MFDPAKNRLVKNPIQLVINDYIKLIGNTHATIVNIHNIAGFSWLIDTITKHMERLQYQEQVEDP